MHTICNFHGVVLVLVGTLAAIQYRLENVEKPALEVCGRAVQEKQDTLPLG
jgi:hypothetical protein